MPALYLKPDAKKGGRAGRMKKFLTNGNFDLIFQANIIIYQFKVRLQKLRKYFFFRYFLRF